MKKSLLGTMLVALLLLVPVQAMAQLDISIRLGFPPPVVFTAPPHVVVLPDTDDVYVVPDIEAELFFWSGWWWRPWQGRWYRSRYYDQGWVYYRSVPSFYFDVDPGWRRYYSVRLWYGRPWAYEPIPYRHLQRNWETWHQNRYWERERAWGVRNYQPRPPQLRQDLRQQRQQQYQQRAEVQQYRQRRPGQSSGQSPPGRPQFQPPGPQTQPGMQPPQRPDRRSPDQPQRGPQFQPPGPQSQRGMQPPRRPDYRYQGYRDQPHRGPEFGDRRP